MGQGNKERDEGEVRRGREGGGGATFIQPNGQIKVCILFWGIFPTFTEILGLLVLQEVPNAETITVISSESYQGKVKRKLLYVLFSFLFLAQQQLVYRQESADNVIITAYGKLFFFATNYKIGRVCCPSAVCISIVQPVIFGCFNSPHSSKLYVIWTALKEKIYNLL